MKGSDSLEHQSNHKQVETLHLDLTINTGELGTSTLTINTREPGTSTLPLTQENLEPRPYH